MSLSEPSVRAFGLFALLLMAGSATGATPFQPAQIGTHAASLTNAIDFPNVPGDYTVFVRCEAKIMPGGTIKELGCYDDPKVDHEFFRAIHLGAQNATVTPATVNGENVNVLMLLSVIFRQQGEQRVIGVVPNHGTNAKALGVDYVAPQRYGRGNQYYPRTELGLLWVEALMSATGEPQDITYIETGYTTKETRRYAQRYMANNYFIPGFAEGRPLAMKFIKPIFGYRNGFMRETEASKCRDTLIACDERSNATGLPRYVFDD